MTADSCLLVMQAREIPEALLSLNQLDCPKVTFKGFTEAELEEEIPAAIARLKEKYRYFVAVSDDVIATQTAFDNVTKLLREDFPVVTGFCNLDSRVNYVSLTKTPPQQPYGSVQTYDWMTFEEVEVDDREIYVTYHPSMAMTGMSAENWDRFPWSCYGKTFNTELRRITGWAADLSLSLRLYETGTQIVSPRKSFMFHLKGTWTDSHDGMHNPRRALIVGNYLPEVIYDTD